MVKFSAEVKISEEVSSEKNEKVDRPQNYFEFIYGQSKDIGFCPNLNSFV